MAYNNVWLKTKVLPYVHTAIGNGVYTMTVEQMVDKYHELRDAKRAKRKAAKAARKRNR